MREQGLLRLDLKVRREGASVLLPLVNPVEEGFPVREEEFEVQGRPRGDYRALAHVPAEVKPLLPGSFDVVGDVAILRVPPEVREWRHALGEAILAAYRRLRSVAADEGVGGEYRIRRLEVIAGRRDLSTLHREYGLTLAVDPSRAYFSPRLATERMRVARALGPGEVVLDMFAGVGPFALMVARFGRPSRVYAVDSNPEAFALLRENIHRNGAEGTVVPLLGDARAVVPGLGFAQRIIMDLPRSAADFLPVALEALGEGGLIHYYEIMPRGELGRRGEELREKGREAGRRLEVVAAREVRGYSPSEAHFAFDLRVM